MGWLGTGGLADACTRVVHSAFSPDTAPTYADPDTGVVYTLEHAVFDEAWEDIELDEGAPVATTKPVLDVRLAEFGDVDPVEGGVVTAEGRTFEVAEVRDGTAATSAKLVLFEV